MTSSSVEKTKSDATPQTTSKDETPSEGRTTIADTVVAKIAGIAVREVSGVYAIGGAASRAVGAIRDRIPGSSTNHAQGVSVEVGEKQAAVDVQLIAEYGVSLIDLAAGIRRNVVGSIEGMTGLQVTEVNIDIQDVHIAEDEAGGDDVPPAQPRVQ